MLITNSIFNLVDTGAAGLHAMQLPLSFLPSPSRWVTPWYGTGDHPHGHQQWWGHLQHAKTNSMAPVTRTKRAGGKPGQGKCLGTPKPAKPLAHPKSEPLASYKGRNPSPGHHLHAASPSLQPQAHSAITDMLVEEKPLAHLPCGPYLRGCWGLISPLEPTCIL